jgi:hypothetical protein
MVVVLYVAQVLQLGSRTMDWRRALLIALSVVIVLTYILYGQFILTFFGFLTSPGWVQKSVNNDYIQMSHGPAR